MNRFKKYNMFFAAFVFCAALILIYKSIDNLNSIKDFVGTIFNIIKPFFVGFVIAYILNMPCNKINKRLSAVKNKRIAKKSKGISILLVYLIAIFIVFIVVRTVVPAIYSNFMDMYTNAPAYINKIMVFVTHWQTKLGINIIPNDGNVSAGKMIGDFFKNFSMAEFSKYAQGVINLTSGVINTFIAFIVSIYMLLDSEHIINSIRTVMSVMLGKKRTESIVNYFIKINDIFSKYIYCRVMDGVVMAVLTSILLGILRVKYAPSLGFLIGVCNLIPYFGSIIGTVIATLITFVSGGWIKMLWTFVLLLVLEQIDGNFIGPKIMGEVLEIRPLVVIFAVTVGGGLFGVIGMLISVPVVVVLKMIADDYLEDRKKKIGFNEDNTEVGE